VSPTLSVAALSKALLPSSSLPQPLEVPEELRFLLDGFIYRQSGRNLSCVQDMVLFASSLHFLSEACLLDPWATEAAFCKIPFIKAFRSKEIWLDAFQHISNDPTFMLSAAEKHVIEQGILEVGESGPGPRRLTRWVYGFPSFPCRTAASAH
jgi:hypothetical protein